MDIWEVINRPFVVTLVAVGCGSLAGALIAEHWRRQAARRELQVETVRELLHTYHTYVPLISARGVSAAQEEWNLVHCRFLAHGKMAALVFNRVGTVAGAEGPMMRVEVFKRLAKRMAQIRQLRVERNHGPANEQVEQVFAEFAMLLEHMWSEIDNGAPRTRNHGDGGVVKRRGGAG